MDKQMVQPSEAAPQVQENGGDQPLGVPSATSGAGGGVQEQQTSELSQEEKLRRQEQSMRDKARHEVRLEMQRSLEQRQRQEALEKEQRMLEEMDNEDFGAYVRQRMAREKEIAQATEDKQRAFFRSIEADSIASIKDQKLREQIAERSLAGEFGSYAEFHEAVVNAATAAKVEAELKRREKDIREATKNELTAGQVRGLVPQLGNGLPTAALNPEKIPTIKKLELGIEQALKQKRGG